MISKTVFSENSGQGGNWIGQDRDTGTQPRHPGPPLLASSLLPSSALLTGGWTESHYTHTYLFTSENPVSSRFRAFGDKMLWKSESAGTKVICKETGYGRCSWPGLELAVASQLAAGPRASAPFFAHCTEPVCDGEADIQTAVSVPQSAIPELYGSSSQATGVAIGGGKASHESGSQVRQSWRVLETGSCCGSWEPSLLPESP